MATTFPTAVPRYAAPGYGQPGARRAPSEPLTFPAKCIALSVLCCVFEGGFRKWAFPDSSNMVVAVFYFAKDIPLIVAALYCLINKVPTDVGANRALSSLLAFSTFAVAGGIFVTVQGLSPIGGVMSGRVLLLLPWVAMIVGPRLTSERDLALICHAIGLSACFNAVLGGVQFALPYNHFLNQQVSAAVDVVGSVGRVRGSGTFAFLSGMTALCIAASWAGSVLVTQSPKRPWGYIYAFAGLVCTTAAMSRSGASFGIAIIFFTLLVNYGGRYAIIIGAVVGTVAVSIFGVGSDVNTDTADLSTALIARHQTSDRFDERILGTLSQIPEAMEQFPLGLGLGKAQSSQQATGDFIVELTYFEFELARVVLELGVLGFFGAIGIRIAFGLQFWGAWFNPRLRRNLGSSVAPSATFTLFSLILHLVYDHNLATFWCIAMACGIGGVNRAYLLGRAPARTLG